MYRHHIEDGDSQSHFLQVGVSASVSLHLMIHLVMLPVLLFVNKQTTLVTMPPTPSNLVHQTTPPHLL